MQQQIRTKEIEILNAENGDFDLLLRGMRQNPQQIITKRIRILNAHNGDFELMVEEDHTIEDALIQHGYDDVIEEYYNDRVTDIRDYAFLRTKIKKITIPNATWARRYSFDGENVSLLEEIYLPKVSSLGNLPFQNNPNLRVLEVAAFATTSIRGCPNLTTLIFTNTARVFEPGSALSGNPFAPDGGGGYIYVPSDLLSQYQSSQAWQDYANVLEFRAIEGSIYELEE